MSVDALGDDVILVGLVCLVHGFKKAEVEKHIAMDTSYEILQEM